MRWTEDIDKDMSDRLLVDLSAGARFSDEEDESTDVTDVAQLCV